MKLVEESREGRIDICNSLFEFFADRSKGIRVGFGMIALRIKRYI